MNNQPERPITIGNTVEVVGMVLRHDTGKTGLEAVVVKAGMVFLTIGALGFNGFCRGANKIVDRLNGVK